MVYESDYELLKGNVWNICFGW